MNSDDNEKILDKKSLGKLGDKSDVSTHEKLLGKKEPLTSKKLNQKIDKYKKFNGYDSSHNKYTNK